MGQIAMVIDLNKCIGCQTCTLACKTMWTSGKGQELMWWRKVNTMPGKGSPIDWEDLGGGFRRVGLILRRMNRKMGKKAIYSRIPVEREFGEFASLSIDRAVFSGDKLSSSPEKKVSWMFNWDEDRGSGVHPNSFFFYLPRLCNHCTHPACLEACPRNAIYKREEDGVVLINEEKCHGYRFCMEACPYKVIYFNLSGSIAGETITTNSETGIAQKCIACFPRLEKGVAPACARACPARAVHFGFLEDKNSSVYKLVKKWKVALPLHPEFNTEPNVYYVPPLSSPKFDKDGRLTNEERIPIDYLKSLFGPEVERALKTLKEEREKMRKGMDSELMRILIGFRWPDDFFGRFRQPLHKILVEK